MQPPADLPVLLVSAANQSTAAEFITELVNIEQTEGAQVHPLNTVWEINNKYYKAAVQVYSILDNDDQSNTESTAETDTNLTLEDAFERAEAHVIVMAPHEEWSAAQQRIAFVKGAKHIEVRVCVGMEDSVRSGYECVERAGAAAGRAREALQANLWRGLTLHRPDGAPGLDELLNGFSSGEEDDGDDNDDWGRLQQYGSLDQATRFIEQAGQVREMAQGASDETEEQREARLRRAVGLLAAFCRFGDLN